MWTLFRPETGDYKWRNSVDRARVTMKRGDKERGSLPPHLTKRVLATRTTRHLIQ